MALTSPPRGVKPGDYLLVVRKLSPPPPHRRRSHDVQPKRVGVRHCLRSIHSLILRPDNFDATSPDELTLRRGEKIELVEMDDGFGDGWYLGKDTSSGASGLFPGGRIPFACPRREGS